MISYDLSSVRIVLVITGRFAREVAINGDDAGVFRGAGAPFTFNLSITVAILVEMNAERCKVHDRLEQMSLHVRLVFFRISAIINSRLRIDTFHFYW